ncbi:unnamed protein product [Prorocentrum cordatum]|uniref:NADH dehydrogenase [ubiquinone] 1 beta subcomplex subunit 10 n=1 Tax=Prorocentrum cordatum TaxID=2364126 RepID=A0ABN9RUX8_9DINO|nr:unnamed protein product [Polarella glacialis]
MSDTESFAVVPSEFAEGPVVPCPLVRRSNGANVPFLEYRPIHDAHLMKDGHIKKQQQWERDNRDRCIEAPHFAEAEAWAAAEDLIQLLRCDKYWGRYCIEARECIGRYGYKWKPPKHWF